MYHVEFGAHFKHLPILDLVISGEGAFASTIPRIYISRKNWLWFRRSRTIQKKCINFLFYAPQDLEDMGRQRLIAEIVIRVHVHVAFNDLS